MNFGRLGVVLLCLGLATAWTGCGDDDNPGENNANANANENTNDNSNQNNNTVTYDPFTGTLDQLDGHYELTEMAIKPSVVETVITREKANVNLPELGGTAAMCRGYATLASTSGSEGSLGFRWGIVAEAFQYGDVGYYMQQDDWALSWEQSDGKLVMDVGGQQAVYVLEFDAEVMTLHLDKSDLRNDFDDLPVRFVLTRTTPPTSILEGTWVLQNSTYNVGEADEYSRYNECAPHDSDDPYDGEYGFDTETWTITPGGWLDLDSTAQTWDSSDCSGTTVHYSHGTSYGFVEIDPTNGRLDYNYYLVDGYQNEHGLGFDYTLDGTELTLTFIEYRNITASPGNYPDVLVYHRQP